MHGRVLQGKQILDDCGLFYLQLTQKVERSVHEVRNPVTSSFSYPVTDSRVVQGSLRSSQIKNNMADVCSADPHT